MRPERWTTNALAFAIACGMTAAIAHSQTAIADQGQATWTSHPHAAALAQADVQRRNKTDFPREQQAQRDVEREEMQEDLEREEGAMDVEVEEGDLTEEQATELAADQGLIRGTSAIGKPLYNTEGEKIGQVRNFAIDTDRNQIALVVVSFGGQFGFGGDYVAIPFQAFEPAENAEGLATDLTRADLEGADSFSANDWPDMSSRQVVQRAYEQFGYEPYWTRGAEAEPGVEMREEIVEEDVAVEENGEAREEEIIERGEEIVERGEEAVEGDAEVMGGDLPIVRATELLGRPVRSTMEDNKLGNLSDMVIDGREGRIVYGVLSTGGFFGFGEENALVPYRALRYEEAEEQFALDADEDAIEAVAFADDEWPDLTNERWASNLHLSFNEEPYWQTFGYVAPAAGAGARDRGMMADQTPRDILEEAGVSQQEIRAIEQQGYPRRPVELALEEAYRNQGVGADEAQQRAREQADRIEELRQMSDLGGREILRDAGLSEEEIDDLEAGGFEEEEVRSRLEEAYLDQGMSEQDAQQRALEDAQRVTESMETEEPGMEEQGIEEQDMEERETEQRYMGDEQQETEEQQDMQ